MGTLWRRSKPTRLGVLLVALALPGVLTLHSKVRAWSSGDVVCYATSSGDQWVWGSASACPTQMMAYISTDSYLYKWDGSTWNFEDMEPSACNDCQADGTSAATPPGAGWRYVQGFHSAAQYGGTPGYGLSGPYTFWRD